MKNPFLNPVKCVYSRKFTGPPEPKDIPDGEFIALNEADARKLVGQWNRSNPSWSFQVLSVSPCELPEGDLLEEYGVKYVRVPQLIPWKAVEP